MINTLLDTYNESNYVADFAKLYDDFPNAGSGFGQSFTTPNDGKSYRLEQAKFYLNRNGAPVGAYLTAVLYAHSGIYGTDSVPTGAALATSGQVDASTLGAGMALITFTFTGANRVTVTPNTHYVIAIQVAAKGNFDVATCFVRVADDNTAPTHSGNGCAVDTTWSAQVWLDYVFYVYGSEVYVAITPSSCVIDTTGKTLKRVGLTNQGDGANYCFDIATDTKDCIQVTFPDDNMEIEKLTFYGCTNVAERITLLKGVIYADSGGAPAALLGVTQEVGLLTASRALVDLPFAAPLLLDAGTYWIGVIVDLIDGDNQFAVTYNTETGALVANADDYTDGPSDPFGAIGNTYNKRISLYATYYVEATYPKAFTGYTVASGVLGGKDNRGTIAKEAVRWQEKAFYAAGRIWVFWVDSIQLGTGRYSSWFSSSADNGVTWETPTLFSDEMLENAGETIQVLLDASAQYIHVVTRELYDGDTQLAYRRGLPVSDGTITWTAAKAKAWTDPFAASVDFYACLDSYGYMWISWGLTTAGLGGDWNNMICFVTRNANNDGTWSTAGAYPVQLGTAYDTNNFIVPLKNGRLYCFYFKGGEQIKGKLWNGVAWSAEETVTTNNILPQYSGGGLPFETWSRGCAVDDNDTIHLVFLDTGEITGSPFVGFSYNVRYVTRDLSDGWSSETVIQTDCFGKGVSPNCFYNETDRYVQFFWTGEDLIYSRRVVDGYIQAKQVYVDERTEGIPVFAQGFYNNWDGCVNSFVKLFNGRFGLLYITGEEPAYSIKFALESFGVEYSGLDSQFFNNVKDAVKKGFGVTTFNVTLSTLSLGAPDSVTGWYEPIYTDSTIEMIIQTQASNSIGTVTGYFVHLDGVGYTTAQVSLGSKITDAMLRVWRIESVKPQIVGDKLKFYVCDLKELTLHE